MKVFIILLLFTLKVNAQVYLNGFEYYTPSGEVYEDKHPYYGENSFSQAKVWYFHQPCNITAKYDLASQEVVIRYDRTNIIALYYEQIDSFKLQGAKFVKNEEISKTHFVQEAYASKPYKLFVKYTKHYSTHQVIDGRVYNVLTENVEYYLVIDNALYKFKNVKQLCKILSMPTLKHPDGSLEEMIQVIKYREQFNTKIALRTSKTT